MPASTDNEIILIGGRDLSIDDGFIAPMLVEKSGGEVGFVPFARVDTADEQAGIEKATRLFAKYGGKLRVVRTVDDLGDLSLIYYCGGNHIRLYHKLKETGLHNAILNSWRKGEVVLAGSSAGSMVVCGVMLEDESDNFDTAPVSLTYGLGPLGACFVVPHWKEWVKSEWEKKLLAAHGEGYYIFGIDENTAMTWRAGKCEVIGAGQVHARGRMTGDWGNGEEFEVARGW